VFVNNALEAACSFISHHKSTSDSQLFNILQQECYPVAGGLKCHNFNLCSKYRTFSLTQAWSRMCHSSYGRITTVSCCNIIPYHC